MSIGLIGHKKVLSFFEKAIESSSLSHAYCLIGPKKVGKRRLVEEIAARLLQISPEKVYSAPEVIFVRRLFDEKTEKTKKNIDIEQVREMKSAAQLRSAGGKEKVVIIDDAELLSSGAANALLKILEEPKEKTFFFLLTDDEQALPATIRSRCQFVYLQKVSTEEITGSLKQEFPNGVNINLIVESSNGCPGQAIEWLSNQESFARFEREKERFLGLFGKPFYQKLKDVEEIFGSKDDHIAERDNLREILSLWQVLARNIFFKKKLVTEKYLELQDSVGYARDMLKMNIHPRLLVEKILLIIP